MLNCKGAKTQRKRKERQEQKTRIDEIDGVRSGFVDYFDSEAFRFPWRKFLCVFAPLR